MKRLAVSALCAAAALACALWWWLPGAGAPPGAPAARADRTRLGSLPSAAPAAAALGAGPLGTAAQDPLLAPGLRDALEALLLEAGEAPNPGVLKQRLAALVARHFGDTLATRALALAERYVDYRVALGELQPPPDATDPQALHAAVAARDALRRQYFDESEYAALFADQESLERYTLARLAIERNPDLTEAQRHAALQGAQAELEPAERAARAHSIVQMDVAAETARFNSQGVDARTRHAERSARYGEGAARRLAQLDAEDQQWTTRLDDYARAQAAQASAEQLAELRARSFTAEEQLRLDAALQLRAQAAQ